MTEPEAALWSPPRSQQQSEPDALQDTLKAIPLFADLRSSELKKIIRILHTRTYAPGELIFREGDTGAGMFIIQRGEVRIVIRLPDGGEKALTTLTERQFFGEMALLENAPRSADVIATMPTTCALLSWELFLQDLLGNREVAIELLRTLSRRLRTRSQRLEAIEKALGHVSILQGLSGAELRRIADKAEVHEYPEGATIVTRDDPGRTLYIILEGRVRVVRHGETSPAAPPLAEFGQGSSSGRWRCWRTRPAPPTCWR